MVYRLDISNLFTHNVSIVDSQWTQNVFVRKTHVKIKSFSCGGRQKNLEAPSENKVAAALWLSGGRQIN